MSFSNSAETSILALLFNNSAFAGIGDANGIQPSSGAGDLYVSLHTADPGEGGDQESNEASYGGYARVAVPRTISGFSVSGGVATNGGAVTFPEASSGPEQIQWFAIGLSASGPGSLLGSGLILQPAGGILVESGVVVQFNPGQLSVSLD